MSDQNKDRLSMQNSLLKQQIQYNSNNLQNAEKVGPQKK